MERFIDASDLPQANDAFGKIAQEMCNQRSSKDLESGKTVGEDRNLIVFPIIKQNVFLTVVLSKEGVLPV